jgi:hypothetical protein
VKQHDQGESSCHDWTICLRDGRRVAVEVTQHADEAMRRFWAQEDHHRKMPKLPGLYSVVVKPTADRRKLWDRLPELLPTVPHEVGHRLEYIRWHLDHASRAAAEELVGLGVEWFSFAESLDPAISLSTAGGGIVHPSVVAEAALAELIKNRTKLAAAVGVDERHMFVWIDGSAAQPWSSLRDADGLPEPVLLEGADVLWVGAIDHSRLPGGVSVLWRCRSNEPWEDWTPRLSRR